MYICRVCVCVDTHTYFYPLHIISITAVRSHSSGPTDSQAPFNTQSGCSSLPLRKLQRKKEAVSTFLMASN